MESMKDSLGNILTTLGKAAGADGVKVGIDWDGTVTEYPEVMSFLVQIIGPKNCFVITARRPSDRQRTIEEAKEYGFPMEEIAGLSLYTEEYDYNELPENPELWKKLIDYKVSACKKYGVELMIEDDDKYRKPLESSGVSVLILG